MGCLSKTLSPRTAFDAQLFVERGFPNTLGFSHIQRQTAVIGTEHIHPIQTLDQTAKHNSGKQEYLVQTLHGLACLFQTSSDILKNFSVVFSMFIVSCIRSHVPQLCTYGFQIGTRCCGRSNRVLRVHNSMRPAVQHMRSRGRSFLRLRPRGRHAKGDHTTERSLLPCSR